MLEDISGGMTMRDAVENNIELQEILKEQGTAIDYALPQMWWDDFYRLVKEPPIGFVWLYKKNSIWGDPFPVTKKAQFLLDFYNKKVREERGS